MPYMAFRGQGTMLLDRGMGAGQGEGRGGPWVGLPAPQSQINLLLAPAPTPRPHLPVWQQALGAYLHPQLKTNTSIAPPPQFAQPTASPKHCWATRTHPPTPPPHLPVWQQVYGARDITSLSARHYLNVDTHIASPPATQNPAQLAASPGTYTPSAPSSMAAGR